MNALVCQMPDSQWNGWNGWNPWRSARVGQATFSKDIPRDIPSHSHRGSDSGLRVIIKYIVTLLLHLMVWRCFSIHTPAAFELSRPTLLDWSRHDLFTQLSASSCIIKWYGLYPRSSTSQTRPPSRYCRNGGVVLSLPVKV